MITEPLLLEMPETGVIRVRCWKGQTCTIEASAELREWQPLGTLSNLDGTLEFVDVEVLQHPVRFYRAMME